MNFKKIRQIWCINCLPKQHNWCIRKKCRDYQGLTATRYRDFLVHVLNTSIFINVPRYRTFLVHVLKYKDFFNVHRYRTFLVHVLKYRDVFQCKKTELFLDLSSKNSSYYLKINKALHLQGCGYQPWEGAALPLRNPSCC